MTPARSSRGSQLRFLKDRQFRYANENYNLLSQIIEAATGVPYGQQLSEQIFAPLGLEHSFVVGQGRDAEINQGHVGVLGHFVPTRLTNYGPSSWIQTASGATCSSIDGPLGPEGDYGFGWIHKTLDGEDIFVHVGKVPTHTTVFALIPERSIGITLTVNAGDFLIATPLIEDLADSIIRQVLGEHCDPPKPHVREFRQIVLGGGHLGIICLGLAGWFIRGKKAGKAGFLAYHVLLPLTLTVGLRHASGTPYGWLWKFAPAASITLGFSAANMIASGICKAAHGKQ